MWRYSDGTFRIDAPAKVIYEGFSRKFDFLTTEQKDELGYNIAVPIKREQFTTYETEWVKGDDLVYRETIVSFTVDEDRKFEALSENARSRRDGLLRDCDWTVLADSPVSGDLLDAWKAYRQSLRDITEQEDFPLDIVWPVSPAE